MCHVVYVALIDSTELSMEKAETVLTALVKAYSDKNWNVSKLCDR